MTVSAFGLLRPIGRVHSLNIGWAVFERRSVSTGAVSLSTDKCWAASFSLLCFDTTLGSLHAVVAVAAAAAATLCSCFGEVEWGSRLQRLCACSVAICLSDTNLHVD